jgi:hypothetical protein
MRSRYAALCIIMALRMCCTLACPTPLCIYTALAVGVKKCCTPLPTGCCELLQIWVIKAFVDLAEWGVRREKLTELRRQLG